MRVINSNGFRVLVDDEDLIQRINSPMKMYKLSPEEIQKQYGHIKGSGEKLMHLEPFREAVKRRGKWKKKK